jgi:hypothetical protein
MGIFNSYVSLAEGNHLLAAPNSMANHVLHHALAGRQQSHDTGLGTRFGRFSRHVQNQKNQKHRDISKSYDIQQLFWGIIISCYRFWVMLVYSGDELGDD